MYKSMDDYVKECVDNGTHESDGKPIKCFCGSEELYNTNFIYGEVYVEEYECRCVKCDTLLGYWSYGFWQWSIV